MDINTHYVKCPTCGEFVKAGGACCGDVHDEHCLNEDEVFVMIPVSAVKTARSIAKNILSMIPVDGPGDLTKRPLSTNEHPLKST